MLLGTDEKSKERREELRKKMEARKYLKDEEREVKMYPEIYRLLKHLFKF